MTKDDPAELKKAVERMHSCIARYVEAIPVTESFQGKPVWEGTVHVFDISGHPKATRAYAWSSPIEGSPKRRFFTVLGMPPVKSAVDAVRVAIIREYKAKKDN